MKKTKSIYPRSGSANMTLDITSEDSALLIQSKNMPDDGVLLIEYKFGDDCEHTFEPLIWCCGQTKMVAPTNQLLLPPIPGSYRGVLVQIDDTGQVKPFDEEPFMETQIQYIKVETNRDLTQYYSPCCS